MSIGRLRPTALLFGLAALLTLAPAGSERAGGRPGSDAFAPEIARLERRLAHVAPGSAEAASLRAKLARIDDYRSGKPGFDEPNEFARYLSEMKIPADRTTPEYEPGYQKRELDTAIQAVQARGPAGAALPWLSRGPGNVAGRARGIVVDPDDPTHNTWFIASVGGGVWMTSDAGSTWNWMTPDFPVLSTSAIAMAASNHDILYVGTGESYFNVDVINGDGILKSTDRGVSWSPLASTVGNPAFNNVARIIVDPVDPDVVLAATTRGTYKESLNPRSSIFRSTDGGASWTEVYASTTLGGGGRVKKLMQIIADPTDFNIQYATVDEAGILKSTNRGLTWVPINTGITDLSGRFELAVSPIDHNRLFASAEGASRSELWISTNGGTSWSRTFEAGTEPNWLGAQGWYDNTIVCHPTNVNVVYVGGIWPWKITLSGTSRTSQFLTSAVHADQHNLVVIDDGGGNWRLLNTNDGGVAVSGSQDTGFTRKLNGLVTTQFYGVDKRPGASAYVGGMQDNGTWQSPIEPGPLDPWTFAIGGDGYETSWHFDDPQRLIGGYQYNGLQRSLDGGATWSSAVTSVSPPGSIDNGGGNAPFITKIAKSPLQPDRLFVVGRQGVWRSYDFGGTWSLSAIPVANWGAISSFHNVKISRANPDVIYAGSRMDGSGQLLRSTNAGVTFTPLANYAPLTLGRISGISTHPTDANTAYALFSFAQRPKIIRTTDGGASWVDLTGFNGTGPSANDFPDVAVYDLLVLSSSPSTLWAATEIGLVESLDSGATWHLADNGLPNVGVWFLAEVEDQVVAATHGRGIWSVTMPELVAGKTFNPLLEKVYQQPDGQLAVQLNLRSAYDTTEVKVNGVTAAAYSATAAGHQETLLLPVIGAGPRSVVLSSKQGVDLYTSVTRTVEVFAPQAPVLTYVNNFEAPSSDFSGSLFTIGPAAGFSGSAIQSPHPYSDTSNPVYTLSVPIQVAWTDALLEFDEVALVEPGDPGSVFGDGNFYDYVIVEGSSDGCQWVPLLPGYDARAYPEWETAFNSATAPTAALLRHRTIDLQATFPANQTILVRFRLFADEGVSGWGWIIDNLSIQRDGVSAVGPDGRAPRLGLAQNAPNPLRASTSIRFELPRPQSVALDLFDVQGRLVRSLVSGMQTPGEHTVEWDGRDESGRAAANGLYFYRLITAEGALRRKMVVLR